MTAQKIVLEERNARVTDQPLAVLAERYRAAPKLLTLMRILSYYCGWLGDIKQLITNDLYAWYYRWYQPSNSTLIVVKDVEPQVVLQQAQQAFGNIIG